MPEGTINLFRVEHKESKIGPYTEPNDISDVFQNRHQDSQHPNPYEESGLTVWMEENKQCAFQSIEQLKRWFSIEDRKRLNDYGFHIVELSVFKRNIVGQLPKQCVFKRTKTLKYIRTFDILSV